MVIKGHQARCILLTGQRTSTSVISPFLATILLVLKIVFHFVLIGLFGLVSTMWALCLRMCCLRSNNKDERSPMVSKKSSQCFHRDGFHCIACRFSSRKLARDRACAVNPLKRGVGNLAGSSKPSSYIKIPQSKKPNDTDSKLEIETKQIAEVGSNWLNKDEYRDYYPQCNVENEAKKLEESTGAISKLKQREKSRAKHGIGKTGKLHMDALSGDISKPNGGDAPRYGYSCDTRASFKRTRQCHETEIKKSSHKQVKRERPVDLEAVKIVETCGRRAEKANLHAIKRSPHTIQLNHIPGDESYCSEDSDYTRFAFRRRKGRKRLIRKKRQPLSKSDGQVGAWFDDHVDTIPITVSLSDIGTEQCDAFHIRVTPEQQAVTCFRQDMGDVGRSNDLDSARQGCLKQESDLSRHNDNVLKVDQATNTSENCALESPRSLLVNLFDDLSYGTVNFKASYYHTTKRLFVHIENVQKMPPKAEIFFYSVMLKLAILPNDVPKNSATVKSSDMNPYFREDFTFIVTEPSNKVLKISAYDADLQGKYNSLGHAIFHLKLLTEDMTTTHSCTLLREPWVNLWPGRLEVTLKFEETTKALTVIVHRGEGLAFMFSGSRGTSQQPHPERYNSFAKVTHYCAGIKLKEKRSGTIFNSRDPIYNSSFKFNLSLKSPHENFIVVSIKLKFLLKESQLGRVIFGPLYFASGSTHTPWGLAIAKNETVTSWYKLYL